MRELVDQFRAFTKGHNEAAKPFAWAATAQSILENVERVSTRISDLGTISVRNSKQAKQSREYILSAHFVRNKRIVLIYILMRNMVVV